MAGGALPEAPDEVAEAFSDEEIGELREAIRDGDGLNKLRNMADELGRTLLMAQFHQDGYRCLFEANSLVQALRAQGLPKKTPVVVIQRKPEVRLTVAAKAGGASLLVDHPVDFAGCLKNPMETLLGLA